MEGKKELFVAIYCAPDRALGEKYPSRIKQETYDELADLGLTHIFGHYEMEDGREIIHDILDYCKNAGLTYSPRDPNFYYFLGRPEVGTVVHKGEPTELYIPPFDKYSDEEKKAICEKMVEGIKEYIDHPACGGVHFTDEPGSKQFDGIACAKKAYEKNFGKPFYLNHLNYCLSESAVAGLDIPRDENGTPTGDYADGVRNRFRRYDKFISTYIEKAKPDRISQDLYPFNTLWTKNTFHRALFELNYYFAMKKKTYPMEYYNFLQVGAFDSEQRPMKPSEMSLQIGVTLAYGHEGILFFPGMFPRECFEAPGNRNAVGGNNGFIDEMGRKTVYFDMTKPMIEHAKAVANGYTLQSEFLGLHAYGEFCGGFTEEEVCAMADNDCIFRGKLPDEDCIFEGEQPEKCDYVPDITVDTDRQVVVSTFRYGDKEIYLVLNTSVVRMAKAKITLNREAEKLIEWGEEIPLNGREVELALPAGEYVLIV